MKGNKKIVILGMQQNSEKEKPFINLFNCIVTNDEKGKTLSINNGKIQFSIPFEPLEKYLRRKK